MEIAYPDISDWVEAGDYLTKLRSILRFANTLMEIWKKVH